MKQGFPWVLAAQYLMAGVGSVVGVLSAALASIAIRELKEVSALNFDTSVRRKSSSELNRKASSTSNAAIIINHMHCVAEKTVPDSQEQAITDCNSTGVFETSFP